MLRVIYERPSDGSDQSPTPDVAPLVAFGAGFHGEEREESEAFRWMGSEGALDFSPGSEERYLEMGVFSPFHDLSQSLAVESGGARHELPLPHGWGQVSIPVAAGASKALLAASPLLPPAHQPDDPRELAVRVRAPRLHGDSTRHAHVERQQRNAVVNLREMLDGRSELAATPRNLGIDLYGVCNVKPPCVYCAWDMSKELEGDNVDVPFTRETLRAWGDLFDNAASLVNCSIGEPFMMKEFDDLLDAFGEQGKTLEMATNGQILTDRNIQRLLGRRIHLYVSLDAATADTYAKLRNENFDRILVNLRRLIEAKGGWDGLPKVHLVFMPMRVNLHELEAFVRLCADLGVDRMVLRPLNYDESSDLDWERGGHHFRYEDELLPWDDLVRASGRAAELCRLYGVELSDQMDFGGAMGERFPEEFERGRSEARAAFAAVAGAPIAVTVPEPVSAPAPARAEEAEADSGSADPGVGAGSGEPLSSLGEDRLPLCTEPWKSLYILRRGILPCCYGSAPIAGMEEYREAWNSPILQGIRRDLAAGRFHEYCLNAESCPIVRKSAQARGLSPGERRFLRLKRVWNRIDRLGRGAPGRLLGPAKRGIAGAARRLVALAGD